MVSISCCAEQNGKGNLTFLTFWEECSYYLLGYIKVMIHEFICFIMITFFSCLLLSSFTPLEFFTSVLADGFSLEFEWQQVSSSLQDLSQYSGRPQQCCRLDSLHPSVIIIIIIIYSLRVFHIGVSWWLFTGVWVTASLLKSAGLVSGFWPFSTMLSFG